MVGVEQYTINHTKIQKLTNNISMLKKIGVGGSVNGHVILKQKLLWEESKDLR